MIVRGNHRQKTFLNESDYQAYLVLVYLARECCGIKARVLAEHLNRDASMVSRLHAAYAVARDKRSESELQRLLRIKSTTHA